MVHSLCAVASATFVDDTLQPNIEPAFEGPSIVVTFAMAFGHRNSSAGRTERMLDVGGDVDTSESAIASFAMLTMCFGVCGSGGDERAKLNFLREVTIKGSL